MSDNDERNKTEMAFEAIVDDAKERGVIDAEGSFRVKRRFRINSAVSKWLMKIVKSWYTYAITLISGIGAEIGGLINMVD